MDLVAVDSATKDLLDKVNALGKPKTILDAFPILISRNAAEATLKKATDDATNNPTNYQFSVEQAQDVGQLVRGSLIPDVGSLLQAMKDKKVSFSKCQNSQMPNLLIAVLGCSPYIYIFDAHC